LNVITRGSIQSNDRHSSVGVIVTCVAGAPGRFADTNTSGGLLLYEYTRPTVESSGETTASFDPVIDVIRVRSPPSMDTEYRCRSPGWTSLVVM
jgi:hypothetical protein